MWNLIVSVPDHRLSFYSDWLIKKSINQLKPTRQYPVPVVTSCVITAEPVNIDMRNSFNPVVMIILLFDIVCVLKFFVYYPCRCLRNRSPSKIPPLRLLLGRQNGYMDSETRRPL